MCLQNYNIFFIHANFLAKIAFQAAFFTLIFAFLAAKYINFAIKHAGSAVYTGLPTWVYFFEKKFLRAKIVPKVIGCIIIFIQSMNFQQTLFLAVLTVGVIA